MRICCFYSSTPHPKTIAAIEKFAPQTEFVKTEGLFGYNKEIALRWDASDDLVVIEQDKEITKDVIPAFASCSEPWCTFEYDCFPGRYRKAVQCGLGCAKFSVNCQLQIPVESFLVPDYPMGWPCPDCNGAGCWRYLDTRMAVAILSRCVSFSPHVHGRVNHYHNYPPDWAQQRGLESIDAHSQ